MATLTFSPTQTYDRAAEKPARVSFLSRVMRALMESRERQANREIARVRSMLDDGKLTRSMNQPGTLPF